MNGGSAPKPPDRRSTHAMHIPVKGSSGSRLRQPAAPLTTKRWLLLVTLVADGLAALALGGLQLYLTCRLFTSLDAVFGALEAAIFFAVSGTNLWAADGVRRTVPAWARNAVIAQLAVLFLALYIVAIAAFKSLYTLAEAAAKTNGHQFITNGRQLLVFAVAVIISLIALTWIVLLIRRAAVKWNKTAVVMTALLPFAGLLQFWLQAYYLPQTSDPQVDVSVDLSAQGKTQATIHLAAKVTFHNRGAAKVNVAGALMRVTGYAKTTQQPEPTAGCRYNTNYVNQQWCQIEGGLDLSNADPDSDFRVNPTQAVNAHLLYAGTFMEQGILMPGETDTIERDVDLDPGKFQLARLSVSAGFLTERRIQDTRSCWSGSKITQLTDPEGFSSEASVARHFNAETNIPIIDPRLRGSYTCIEEDIAPRDAIDFLIGNRTILHADLILSNPQDHLNEYPQIQFAFGIRNPSGETDFRSAIEDRIFKANPSGLYQDVSAEYAPADDIQPKGKS